MDQMDSTDGLKGPLSAKSRVVCTKSWFDATLSRR